MVVRRLLAALLFLPVLASCSDDPESSDTGDPTTPVTTTPTPTATPPPEPEEAGDRTKAGAKAFVEYWVALYSAAVTTGDTERMSELSTHTCRGCGRIVDLIDEIYDSGGEVATDGWDIRRIAQAEMTSADEATVQVILRLHPEVISRPGSPAERHPGSHRAEMTFDVVWESSRWAVRELYQGLQ